MDSSGNVTQHKKICFKDGNPICADIDNDPNNCGECGEKCINGEVCKDGGCVTALHCPIGKNYLSCSCSKSDKKCFDYTKQSDDMLGCMEPTDSGTCGVDDCEKMAEYLFDEEKRQHYICPDDMVCNKHGTTYNCECPLVNGENIYILKDGKCLNPFDNETCGVTLDHDGTKCDSSMMCDGKTCQCLPGTILCGDKCIDPHEDSANCGGCTTEEENHDCNKKYRDDGEENKEICMDGKCVCGIESDKDVNVSEEDKVMNKTAMCKIENKLAYCTNIYDSSSAPDAISEELVKYHCGAKGSCNSEDPGSLNYKGTACDSTEICKDGECVCDTSIGNVLINGMCINPYNDNQHCGATNDSIGEDCTKYPESYCRGGRCDCYDGKELFKNSPKIGCFDIDKDPNCCGETCDTCEDGQYCKGRQIKCTHQECGGDKINCKGRCLSKVDDLVKQVEEGSYECVCSTNLACPKVDNDPNLGCIQHSVVPYTGKKLEIVIIPSIGERKEIVDHNHQRCGSCDLKCSSEYKYCLNKSENPLSSIFECGCDDGKIDCIYEGESNEHKCLNAAELHLKGCNECEDNWGNLNGKWEDGCEVYLLNDAEHCGSLENNCYNAVVNAKGVSCNQGICTALTCIDEKFGNCDDDWKNGCETDLTAPNNQHCHTCGHSCRNGMECQINSASTLDCCYAENKGCDNCHIDKSACCAGLTLYREYGELDVTWNKDSYICAKSKPDGKWKEVQ